jgi:transmembrane 9 superfamily member 2/4
LKREVAWKKLSGDIFRRPKCRLLLSVLFGTGIQLTSMMILLLTATFAGSISPFSLPIIKGLLVFLFPLCGAFGGFSAGRLYAFLKGTELLLLWLFNSLLFPAMIGTSLLIVDVCEYFEAGRF